MVFFSPFSLSILFNEVFVGRWSQLGIGKRKQEKIKKEKKQEGWGERKKRESKIRKNISSMSILYILYEISAYKNFAKTKFTRSVGFSILI